MLPVRIEELIMGRGSLWSAHKQRSLLLYRPLCTELFVAVRAIGSSPLPWERLYTLSGAFPTEADVQVVRARSDRVCRCDDACIGS